MNTLLTNWLLGLATVAATGSMAFAWSSNIKLTILEERDREKTGQISNLEIKTNNLEIANYDIRSRLVNLENKHK